MGILEETHREYDKKILLGLHDHRWACESGGGTPVTIEEAGPIGITIRPPTYYPNGELRSDVHVNAVAITAEEAEQAGKEFCKKNFEALSLLAHDDAEDPTPGHWVGRVTSLSPKDKSFPQYWIPLDGDMS